MHNIDPLGSDDLALLAACRREAEGIQQMDDFKAWTRSHVRPLLPHGALACVHGRTYGVGVSLDYVVTVDYPLAHLQEIRNASGHMDSPLARCWFEQQSPVFFDANKPPAYVSTPWLASFRKHGLCNAAADGVLDAAGCIATYFSFHQLPALDERELRGTLQVLTPLLHKTFARVIHLHREKSASLACNYTGLTAREQEIITHISQGKNNVQIGSVLGVSEFTVRNHNALNNALTGNGGNNTLKGGAGDDRLDGGAGNDLLQGDDAEASFGARVSLSNTYTIASGCINATVYPREMADINGDGRADIVAFGGDGVYTSLAQANGTYTAATRVSGEFGLNSYWTGNDIYPRKLADVNGDGKADIVAFAADGTYVALASGAGGFGGFGAARMVLAQFGTAAAYGGWITQTRCTRELADVNGDGRADVVGFGGAGVLVSLGNADGTFQRFFAATPKFCDVDGWTNNDLYVRKLADVNGDHRADIVGFGIDGAYVALANSNGTFGAMYKALSAFGTGAANGGWASQTTTPRELADVNGDGRADIVGFGSTGLSVALGQANGYFDTPQSIPGLYTAAQGWTNDNLTPLRLADINGDGRADLVGFGSTEVAGMLSNAVSGNDSLYGGDGNDTLQGLAGNDVLDGQAGDDVMSGGSGGDTYQMNRGYGADTVQENDAKQANVDVLSFGTGIAANQLWFSHTGNDLAISIIGTADKMTVQNWYLGNTYHVEQIKVSDGKVLLDTQVDALVQAMAGFTPPAMGQTTLSASLQTSLAPVLAANWH